MISAPKMTQPEAIDVVRHLVAFWPHPELEDGGLVMLAQAVLDTGLTQPEAMFAIRHLMQEVHEFRPQPAELRTATPTPPPAYFQPFGELPQVPPASPEEARAALDAMRSAIGAGDEPRAARAEREAKARGSMRDLIESRRDRYPSVGAAATEIVEGLA